MKFTFSSLIRIIMRFELRSRNNCDVQFFQTFVQIAWYETTYSYRPYMKRTSPHSIVWIKE